MKFFSVVIIFLIFQTHQGQLLQGGVKGGLNWVQDPKIDIVNTSISDIKTQVQEQNTAYHIGLFAKIALVGFYIRPEANYSHYKSSYLDVVGDEFSIQSNRLGFPLLIGFQPVKTFFVHGGLVGAYYFGDENTLPDVEDVEYQDFKFGLQGGAGLSFGKISIEGRFEFPFSDRTIDFIADNTEYEIETNPSQFMLSMGYKF